MADTRVVFDDGALRRLMGQAGPVYPLLVQLGNEMEAGAKRDAPYRTGRLRASIRSEVDATDADTLVLIVGTTVHYAPHVEYGTRFMRAQPFLRPQLQRLRLA